MRRRNRFALLLFWGYLLLTLLPSGGRVLCMRPLAEPAPEWADWEGHCACGAGGHGHQALVAAEPVWSGGGCFDLRLNGEWARLHEGGVIPLGAEAAAPLAGLPPGLPGAGLLLRNTPVDWGHAPPRALPPCRLRQALMGVFLC